MKTKYTNVTRYITTWAMIVVSVLFVLVTVVQFSSLEGWWIMDRVDPKKPWIVHTDAQLNWYQLGLSGVIALSMLFFTTLHDYGKRYTEHAFSILLAVVTMTAMNPSTFESSVPQSFWFPVIFAAVFADVYCSIIVFALQLGFVFFYWGISGAFASFISWSYIVSIFAVLGAGRFMHYKEMYNALHPHVEPETVKQKTELPGLKVEPTKRIIERPVEVTEVPALNISASGAKFLAEMNKRNKTQPPV